MTFKVFVRPPVQGRPLEAPAVRVGNTGHVLHLNTKAREVLGTPERVLLLRDGKSIAFKPASADEDYSFAVTKGNIACRSFIRQAGLEPGEKLGLRLEDGLLQSGNRG